MAKPPQLPPKKPSLPGLGAAPLRPSGRAVTGLPTALPATDMRAHAMLATLAMRIAVSCKHTVILETHTSSMLQSLATHVAAAATLSRGGYSGIYSEVDKRMLRGSSSFTVFPKTITRLSKPAKGATPKVSTDMLDAFAQTVSQVFSSTSAMPVYAVGDEYITADEALRHTRAHVGRSTLLIEDAYVAAIKKARDREFNANPASRSVPLWDELLKPAMPFPAAIIDLVTMANYWNGVNKDAGTKYISSLARELATPTNPKHIAEFEMLFERAMELRTAGAGDAMMAANAIAHAHGKNMLFVVGAGHGLPNSDASLPNQLAAQTGCDAQVILPVQKTNANLFYGEMVRLNNRGELRHDIIIFDMETGSDVTCDAWMAAMKRSLTPPQNSPPPTP